MFDSDASREVGNLIHDSVMKKLLGSLGIERLNPIQAETVVKGLFFHQNFLICTPSGSGKTLIATMGVANIIFKNFGKAIYLVPYRALAMEKAEQYHEIFEPFGLKVQELTSDTGDIPLELDDVDLLITTFEKCDSLFRQSHPFIDRVKIIILDEVHEMGLGSRGARLEILITRLLSSLRHIQTIALSATIRNYDFFHGWLETFGSPFALVHSETRPVKLDYRMEIAPNKFKAIKANLGEQIPAGGQVLIFVNKRKHCISYAQELQKYVSGFRSDADIRACDQARAALIKQRSLAKPLIDTIRYGIGYHNASLGKEERALVEDLFRNKHLKALIATTTLAAGVNTPARVVIVADIIQHRKNQIKDRSEYNDPRYMLALKGFGLIKPHSANLMFQMLGRAGRFGYDDTGIAIMLLRDQMEVNFAKSIYFQSGLGPTGELRPKYADLYSQVNSRDILQESILLTVARAGRLTRENLAAFLRKTYYTFQMNSNHKNAIQNSDDLLQSLFITRMTIRFLLNRCGDPSLFRINPVPKVKITKLSPDMIEASLSVFPATYHCRIGATRGFYCSCNHPGQKKKFSENDTSFTRFLCPHLTFLIAHTFQNPDSGHAKILKSVIPVIMKHDYILDYLSANGLITARPHGSLTAYEIAPFGRLAVQLYIYPRDLVQIRGYIENYLFTEESLMLDKIVRVARRTSYTPPKTEAEVIKAWMGEYTMDAILADYPTIGVADLFNLKSEIARFAGIFSTVARFFGKHDLSLKFDQLGLRIKHGIKGELIDLMERLHPNISRNKARLFYNAGYPTATMVLTESPIEIAQKTGLKMPQVMEVRGERVKQQTDTKGFKMLDSYTS